MQEDQQSLKSGTILQNYEVIRVLGEGGFGITYLAIDRSLGLEVVIKEYFPNEFAIRTSDMTITAKSTISFGDFSKGKQRFKEEAQTLAKFNHPSIVKILGYFEENDTAYFVMEYEEGIDLSQYLKQQDRALGQEEILSIVMPILEGLKEVHAHNYLHRDIKPGNILLRANKSPVLIDFGASKLAMGEASKSITSMLTEGYAPLEQYSTNIKQQGPFTDLYAVAAVIYKMITENVPPSAQTRSYDLLQDGRDPFESLVALKLSGYDINFLNAVDRALAIKAKDRPQNVQEFQADIAGKLDDEVFDKSKNSTLEKTKKTNKIVSQENFQYLNKSKVKIPDRKFDNVALHTKEKNVSFIKNIVLIFAALVIAIGMFEYYKNNSTTKGNNEAKIIQTHIESDAMDSYDNKRGWGKAPVDIHIEPINIRLGKTINTYSDHFKYPTPVVEVSVKNNGDRKLQSFGIFHIVKDIDNKRVIGRSGQASGEVEVGWTSKKLVLSLFPGDYSKVTQDNKAINFTISIDVYVKVRDGSIIKLYDAILSPEQLNNLPVIGY